MNESQVPAVATHVSPSEIYAALRAEWRNRIGTEPERASLLVLLSQWSLETGNGAACMNYNLAGIKYTKGCGHDWATYRTTEFINGKKVVLDQDFRAYPSVNEGVSDYLYQIRGTFGFAWPAVEAGNTADFAHRLKIRSYYTAPESEYAAGLAARYTLLDRTIGPDTQPEIQALPDPIEEARDERIAHGPTLDPPEPDKLS